MVAALAFDEFGDAGIPPDPRTPLERLRDGQEKADRERALRLKAISVSGEARIVKQARRTMSEPPDGPTREREAKGSFTLVRGELEGRRITTATRDMAPTLIARLHKKGRIDNDQLAAARWYYETWYRAGFESKACAWLKDFVDGGRSSSEGEEDRLDAREAARHALQKARDFLGAIHPSAVSILDRVVIWGETAAEAAAGDAVSLSPQRTEGRVGALLEVALHALAKHRGIGG